MNLASLKEHPYMVAGGVFVLGVILIVILFGGGKSAPVAVTSTSDTAAGTQLAMAQLAAQAQSHAADVAGAVATTQAGAAVSVAQIQGATQQNSDLMAYNAVRDTALAQKDTALGVATITANMNSHISDNELAGTISQVGEMWHASDNALQLGTTQSGNALAAHVSDNATAQVTASQLYGQQTIQHVSDNQTIQMLASIGQLQNYPR